MKTTSCVTARAGYIDGMPKIDILFPSLVSGLLGYAATGSAMGFWIGSVGLWFALTALFVIAAAMASKATEGSPATIGSIRDIEYAE